MKTLKAMIQDREGIPSNQQRIQTYSEGWHSVKLEDAHTLADYSIVDKTMLLLELLVGAHLYSNSYGQHPYTFGKC